MTHGQELDDKGFTLVELLIVVVIIGILATIALPKFGEARDRSYRAAMVTDLKNLAHLQEVYHNTNFAFSDQKDDLDVRFSDGVSISIDEATGTGWSATASHLAIPGEFCGIFHGDATPGGDNPATTESVIDCSF